ncbi:MAG: ABC transporter ATP-binding protein [Mariprofundaceae bacterium]
MNDVVIEVTGLGKAFAGRSVVHGIDITVRRGEIHAFVGPNGSGKTTTIRMLCGLLTPDAGEGRCLGLDIRRENDAIKQRAGYMSQSFSLYADLTVAENLRFAARVHRLDDIGVRVDAALRDFGLEGHASRLAGELSGGWKQRLSLACALLHEPELLLLDEPTSGVDPESRRSFWHEIRARADAGTSVLVSTHYLEEVELYCDRLSYIHDGDILASGTVAQIVEAIGLAAWRLPLLDGGLLARLGREPAVSMAEVIRGGVIVTGPDAEALAGVLDRLGLAGRAQRIEPGLEDVFYHLSRVHRAGGAGHA